MLRKETRFWESLLFSVDCLVLAACWLLAYAVRVSGWIVPVRHGVPQLNDYLVAALFIPIVWAAVFRSMRLFRPRRLRSYTRETFDLLKATTLVTLGMISVSYLVFKLQLSRVFLVEFWISGTLGLLAARIFFREALRFARRRGRNQRHAWILGTDKLGREILHRLRLHPELGVNICGYITTNPAEVGQEIDGVTVLASLESLQQGVRDKGLDLLLVAVSPDMHQHLEPLLEELKDEIVDINLVSSLYQFALQRGNVEEFEGLPIISVNESPMVGWNRVLKRAFDLAVGLTCLLMFAPFLLLIAVLIKLRQDGPVFYFQDRMGLDGRRFRLIKFRTMPTDAEAEGAVWSRQGDGRASRLGGFLRWSSLDEIPQLWNVVVGEMSLVGPRPERPVFVEEFRKQIPRYMHRHRVKAGLTGWAQINGLRGDTSITKRLQCDLFYIEHWSLFFDLKILWRTFWGGFINKSA
jgi:Undecaprenyl-phosphate glucose phosphotransferase